MCVGIPMQILSVEGIAARATGAEGEALIDLSLTGPLTPGTWVLTHLGCAREVISPEEAALIAEALAGLRSLMAGGSAEGAFADLENRSPALPPHLEAARAAGLSKA
ncbi:HypC/HybG/HupF family hydrogenase formation chaperone [Salipiger sp. PrR002]|uniref:HypC/HybG/HupF family hydrogenase formation chaperone n=1 Tax=Salipiger sp. PrR002 TaxID=2706489 RepID=UPI0013BD17FB|nr:HypC/HybG/HupF family hydrogenase formation chaperone [Salipiger sp. PrR002]NDV97721.1 HypC/HybG/HupF family hydrogenase formation chaperone [Salipiger sp. PrR002]NDW55212.1 HypC/HybG/HupF family hydrogenase formation chaperone [Salipiger sp. PrR004]